MNRQELKKELGQFVEVWEDVVRIKDLILAIAISPATTMACYFLAPERGSLPLFFGLGGALIGFVLCSLFIKPKRDFKQEIEGES